MFTEEDGRKFIELARHAIEDVFLNKETDLKSYSEYDKKQGVFVTITKNKELRGCIGFTEPYHELNAAIVEAARAAAFEDPRFRPLKEGEFTDIEIEVSVLTVPEPVKVRRAQDYLKEIKAGRDGLIIRAGPYAGLLLPQVATEYGWDVENFLRHLCMKAGLSMDAWQNTRYQIFKFQAQVFQERKRNK